MSNEVREKNISTAREYLHGWKSLIDAAGVHIIQPQARLFDSIAFSLLNKIYRLTQACLLLLEAGFVDEGYGLSRSIIDCALNLRYLTLDRSKIHERASNFHEFVYCEKKHFLQQCRKYLAPGDKLDEIEAFAKLERIEPRWAALVPPRHVAKDLPLNDWKLIEGPEWNGWKIVTEIHPLDPEISTNDLLLKQYAADFRGASAMVHCSIRALDNTFAEPGEPFSVGENLTTTFDHNLEPLIVILVSLHQAVRYAFYGANIDQTDGFDKLFGSTSSKLLPDA